MSDGALTRPGTCRRLAAVLTLCVLLTIPLSACDESEAPTITPTEPPTITATSEPTEMATVPTSTPTEIPTAPPTATVTPTATATGTPVPTSTPEPPAALHVLTHSPGTRTGIGPVDAFLADLEAGDADALVDAVAWEEAPCSTDPSGLIPPPACPEGVADGTVIPVMKVSCDTWRYYREDQVVEQFIALVEDGPRLHSVVRGIQSDNLEILRAGGYAVVLAVTPGFYPVAEFDDVDFAPPLGYDADALYFGVSEDGVTGVLFGCWQSFADLPLKSVEPVLPAPAAPVYAQPPDRDTGVPAVDSAIDAIRADDVDAVVDLFAPIGIPCAIEPEPGFPQQPECRDGEADGDAVEVIAVSGCEGFYERADEYRPEFVRDLAGLYGVLRLPPPAQPSDLWPAPEFRVLFINPEGGADQPWGVGFGLTEDGIVEVGFGCGNLLAGLISPDPDWLLAPIQAPPLHSPGTRTGIEAVDAVLAAIEAGDTGAPLSLLNPREVPCAVTPSGGFPQPPECREGEEDGTPVEVIVRLHCEGSYERVDEADLAWIETIRGLYGVAASGGDLGPYALVYMTDPARERGPGGYIVRVDDGGITAHGPGCEGLLSTIVPGDVEWVLAPIE